MNDEKYVSIEYDTWKNKYLPMEEELKRLSIALQEEQQKKVVHVYLTYCSSKWRSTSRCPVGGYEINGEGPQWKILEQPIRDAIQAIVMDATGVALLTEKEVDVLDKKLSHKMDRIEQAEKRINQRLQHIPRIIKWLFKLNY